MRTTKQNRRISSRTVANNERNDSKITEKDVNEKHSLSSDSNKESSKERKKREDDSESDLTGEEDSEEVEVDINKSGRDTQTRKQPVEKPKSSIQKSTSPRPIGTDKDKAKKLENLRNKTSKKETSTFWQILGYSVALIAIVLGVILAPVIISEELKDLIPGYVRFLIEGYDEDSRFDYSKIFDNKLKELKTRFPNQTSRFWKILKTRGLAHLNDKQPKQPLVILMGAPPSAHGVIDCIAWSLAKTLDPGNDNLGYIDGKNFTSHGGHEAKKIMDEKLERLFQKGGRSALILHLELLPPPSPILFYSYCDNDNAKFKHAGIIFTVHLPEEPNMSLMPAEQEGTVEKYLSDIAWSKYPYNHDAVAALLSRIADTVALVSGETDEVVKSYCPVQKFS